MAYAVALVAVAAVTLLIAGAESAFHVASLSMLYLVAVLGLAVRYGRGPAIFAAVAAFLAFDWFFIEPRYTLTVSDPAEWVSLGLLLVTAIVAGQLAADQRARAMEARRGEREALLLYEVARILSDPDRDIALGRAAERLRSAFDARAAAIDLTDDAGRDAGRIVAGEEAALRTPARAVVLGDAGEPRLAPGRAAPWVRTVSPYLGERGPEHLAHHLVPLVLGERRVGSLLLAVAPGRRLDAAESRVLSGSAAQIAAAIDRARLRRELTETEVTTCGRRSPRSSRRPAASGSETSPGRTRSGSASRSTSSRRPRASAASSTTCSTSRASRAAR